MLTILLQLTNGRESKSFTCSSVPSTSTFMQSIAVVIKSGFWHILKFPKQNNYVIKCAHFEFHWTVCEIQIHFTKLSLCEVQSRLRWFST